MLEEENRKNRKRVSSYTRLPGSPENAEVTSSSSPWSSSSLAMTIGLSIVPTHSLPKVGGVSAGGWSWEWGWDWGSGTGLDTGK